MSRDPSSQGPSWKNPGGGGPRGPARPRGWHSKDPAPKPGKRRGGRLFLLFVAFTAVVAGIGILIWILSPPRPTRVILVGPGATENLAAIPHVAGANGLKEIAKLGEGTKFIRVGQAPDDAVTVADWSKNLAGSEKSVLVFISGAGGVDVGGPYVWLVPPEATVADEAKHRLRIADVIQKLAELPPDQKKLLLLDATQDSTSWSHGLLHNDFARGLKTLEPKINEVPNLVVINSSDADQRSWVSEELQCSVFSYFVRSGLSGGIPNTRKVTAENLFEYLKKSVGTWAMATRAANQDPIMLPAPDKGGMTRASSIELTRPRASESPPETQPAPSILTELTKAWQRFATLAKTHPETNSPVVWRRYMDTLLRAQTVVRQGGSPDALLRRLPILERDLAGAPWPQLQSLPNALPMPGLLGVPATEPFDVNAFNILWDSPDDATREKLWKAREREAETRGGETALSLLRLQAAKQLLDTLDRDDRRPTPAHLATAAKLLVLFDGSRPRPTETHIVALLSRDIDPQNPPAADLIQQALHVRCQAERVSLAGERLTPWSRKAVFDADLARLRGEDLIFAPEPERASQARKLLADAKNRYDAIQRDVEILRAAHAACDRAFAEIPYYARWVANLNEEFPEPQIDRLLKRVEEIGATMHLLASALAPPIPEESADRVRETEKLTVRLREAHDALEKEFNQFQKDLGGAALPSNWHHLNNVLSVPFLDPDRRAALLDHLLKVGRELHSKQQSAGNAPSKARTLSPVEVARRQGRMALAVLGEGWVEDRGMRSKAPPGAAALSAKEIRDRIERPKHDAWWESINDVGEQLGWHWRALGRECGAVTDEAAKQDLRSAQASLSRAGIMARLLDSATPPVTSRDPISDMRRHLLHDLMLEQARRALDANWAAVSDLAPQSFAEGTAERFLRDAELLICPDQNLESQDKARLKAAVTELRSRLKVPRWDIRYDATRDVTERHFSMDYRLNPPLGLRSGFPVIIRRNDAMMKPPAGTPARMVLPDFVEQTPPPANKTVTTLFEIDKTVTVPAGKPSFVSLTLLHRGHRYLANTEVNAATNPSTIWVHRPPEGPGGFAVRADESLRAGAVAIVLDWSASMNGADANKETKYQQAVAALEEVLAGLPRGTVVSLFLLGVNDGSAGPAARRVAMAEPRDFGGAQRGQLRALIASLGTQAEGQVSPITYSIRQARNEGFPRDFLGFKTVLVLTDGDDNVVSEPYPIIEKSLADTEINLQMIFFRASDAEERNARKQFARVAELDPPGKLWSAANKAELLRQLREAMLPRVRVLRDDKLERRLHNDKLNGLRVTLPEENLYHWSPGLEPGILTTRCLTPKKWPMQLDPGDRLIADLRKEDGQVRFSPRRYSDDAIPLGHPGRRAASKDGSLTLALPQCRLNFRDEAYHLDVLAFAERPNPRADELAVAKPQFLWVEIRTQDPGADPLPLSVENAPYFPAPAYRLTVPRWPAMKGKSNPRTDPALPSISAWWIKEWPGESAEPLRRDGKISLEQNFPPRDLTVGDTKIRLEEIRFENSQLKVRLSHPKGKSVLVRAVGLKANQPFNLYEEHRFYNDIGQYTVRFGKLSEYEINQAFTLYIYSVESLRQVGIEARVNLVDPPDVRDPFPVPGEVKVD